MAPQPSLKNLTNRAFGKPAAQQNPVRIINHNNFHDMLVHSPNSFWLYVIIFIQTLQELGAPHVDSFNFLIETGLNKAVENLEPKQYAINDDKLKFIISEASLSSPTVPVGTVCSNRAIFPKECRQRAGTYKGKLQIKIDWWLNEQSQEPIYKDLGDIPIMVKVSSDLIQLFQCIQYFFYSLKNVIYTI